MPRGTRRTIPPHIKELVLLECCYMCGNPRCREFMPIHFHHLKPVHKGGTNTPANLLVLCPNCHAKHHANIIPESALRVWKGMLAALNAANRANVDLLLEMYRMRNDPLLSKAQFSADALLMMAGLRSAGLVEVTSGALAWQGTSAIRVALSQKGVLLVEAWLNGDEATYLNVQRELST